MTEVLLKGNPVHTNSNPPEKGQKAPTFKGVGADLQEKSLSDFRGKKKIICFVPSLDTPVCSMSAKKFNEAMKNKSDVAVIYISCDLPFAQKRFCAAENIENVTTLSLVRSKKPAEDYGLILVDGPLAGLCARAVFVLDEKDNIIYSQIVKEITHEPDYDKALSFV